MALGATALALTCAPAAKAARACHALEIVASTDLDDAWSAATLDLKQHLRVQSDGDCRPMILAIEPAENGGALLIATAAGNRAERFVDNPSALAAVAAGLVASLPDDEPEQRSAVPSPASSSRSPSSPPSSVAAESPAPSGKIASATRAAEVGDPPQVWLGGGIGGEVAVPTSVGMFDVEANADLEVKKWFLTVSLRYGSTIGEALTPHDASYEETNIAIGAGRTFSIARTALQVALLPAVATADVDDDDDSDGNRGSRSELRLGAAIRWCIPLDRAWRFTITADSDFSPRSATHYVRVDSNLPPLPFWTGGLRLGAAGKLL